MRHPQRSEDVDFRILVQREPGKRLYNFAELDEIDVAVDKLRTWRSCEAFFMRHAERRISSLPWRIQIEIWSQARIMGHQLPDGDVLFPIGPKFRNVMRHRFVQPQLPILNQSHHAR